MAHTQIGTYTDICQTFVTCKAVGRRGFFSLFIGYSGEKTRTSGRRTVKSKNWSSCLEHVPIHGIDSNL